MRENRKSGLMRGSNGNGNSRPLLSTLPVHTSIPILMVRLHSSYTSQDSKAWISASIGSRVGEYSWAT